jgi:hypothetical protein
MNLLNYNNIMLPIFFGIFSGILVCLYIQNFGNPSNFIEPFILYGIVFSIIVFLFLSSKIFHVSFIKKSPLKFLLEILFILLITYIYCIIIYHFRGLSIKHTHFIYLSLFFVFIHLLLELCAVFK